MPDLRERLARLIMPAIRHHDRVLCPDASYLARRIVDGIVASEEWQVREAAVVALRAQGLCSLEGERLVPPWRAAMSDRAEEIASTYVRVLANDPGPWGVDLWGTWFPCDGNSREDVTAIAKDIRRGLASALRAYAEEAVVKALVQEVLLTPTRVEEARREEREACVATAESQCRAIIYRGERRGGSLCGRCCACLASAAIRARGEGPG